MTVQEWLGTDNQLGIDIWEKKYRYENETFDEWLNRVSGGNEAIKQLIKERKFLFGGRILSNRGLNKYGIKTTLSNCYVVEPPEDNIESIFECAKKLARTYSYGGGCGVDISKLAPTGAKIRNTAKETTGAVSFMDLYGMITGLIGQNGRRGALMISIACDHPDVERFVELKSDLNKVTKANISVRVTDKFLEAV
jgi:ribonucleoside-diphosphate reductase alpha chain